MDYAICIFYYLFTFFGVKGPGPHPPPAFIAVL